MPLHSGRSLTYRTVDGERFTLTLGAQVVAREPVTTAAGQFEHAVRVETAEGTTWCAPGIGIVRTQQYELVSAETFF